MNPAHLLKNPRALLLALIALCILVYWPGVHGPFMFDDYPNIHRGPGIADSTLSWQAAWHIFNSGFAGPLGRGLSLLTFYLNVQLSGLDAFSFKLTNIIIHAVNGLLIYLLAKQLLLWQDKAQQEKLRYFPLLVSAIWLLHPLNLTSVLYVVQRMTSLSSTFILLTLYFFLLARKQKQLTKITLFATASATSLLLGLLCKENAINALIFAPCIELFILRFACGPQDDRIAQIYRKLIIAGSLFASASLIAYITLNWDNYVNAYSSRDFTLYERLMTQARVVFFYLKLTLLPNINSMTLYHDDFVTSTGLLQPWTTIASIAALIFLLGIAATCIYKKRFALIGFSISWYLGGHLLESSIIPLEMIHEHRNYLSILGPISLLAFLATGTTLHPRLKTLIALFIILFLASLTAMRSSHWGSELSLVNHQFRNHPNSMRSSHEYANQLINLYLATHNRAFIDEAQHVIFPRLYQENTTLTTAYNAVSFYSAQKVPLPKEHEKRIVEILKSTRAYASNYRFFVILVKRDSESKPMLPFETTSEFMRIYTENPRIPRSEKADIYSLAAILYGKELNNPAVEHFLLLANNTHTSFLNTLDLVKYYGETGNLEKFNHYRELAKRMTPKGIQVEYQSRTLNHLQEQGMQ